MAILRPFKAIRPDKKLAEGVVSLPYDVMNRKEASNMTKNNPHSFLHICRSEIDLPEEENPYSPKVYEKAKSNIQKFLEDNILKEDTNPSMYIYRQVMNGSIQTGIVGCVSIDDYENNVIKKHELTRVEKEQDRINHFDACSANTEPVFLTYKSQDEVDSTIDSWIENHQSEYDFTTSDKIQHILWVIDDLDTIKKLSDLFKSVPRLYIADGHHRSASAVKVGLKRRSLTPNYTGDEEFNFFMAVIFPDTDLNVFDYNRVVKDLNGLSEVKFIEAVGENFHITQLGHMGADLPAAEIRPLHKHVFSMFISNTWFSLTPKENLVDETDLIGSLDVSILQDKILEPILGIKDPRVDHRIDFVGGIRGLKWLEHRVFTDMKVAFALYPVSISDLINVSDAGKIMPPKSTWFEPKLGSGLFIHKI